MLHLKNRVYKVIIIIGAARSGTNMLRDVITSLDGFKTWPCDEIPYIWRHGNAFVQHDEFLPSMANARVRKYIRRSFDFMARVSGASFLVEKTCANSLRLEFVHAVLPDAKILYIYRDGVDVVASAMKRWTAPLDIVYSAKKAPFVPLSDLPYYATKFTLNRAKQFFSTEKRLSSWGPVFNGMNDLSKKLSLPEVCAHQWKRSINASERGLKTLEKDRFYRIRYEDFVRRPVDELSNILEFIGANCNKDHVEEAVRSVSTKSIGKGRSDLDSEAIELIRPIIQDEMEKYGYEAFA